MEDWKWIGVVVLGLLVLSRLDLMRGKVKGGEEVEHLYITHSLPLWPANAHALAYTCTAVYVSKHETASIASGGSCRRSWRRAGAL